MADFGTAVGRSAAGLDLPEEVLSMILSELDAEHDFRTLLKCALTSRSLANVALRLMYQSYDQAPVFLEEIDMRLRPGDFHTRMNEVGMLFEKWTLIWRSIIISSVDDNQTYKPYCRYLRTLDLRNLENMFRDLKFTPAVMKKFFAGAMQKFYFPTREYKRQTVDVLATINAVGETVTAKTTLLEEISGHLSPGFLDRWISKSPKLQSLVLERGQALAGGAGEEIAKTCQGFRSLTIKDWLSPDADTVFATFLDDLRAPEGRGEDGRDNILRYFEMISYNDIGPQALQCLSRHVHLQELILNNLAPSAVENLNKLKDCTNLHTLVLEDNQGRTRLEELHNDVFLEVVAWLSSCSKLRDLTLKKFYADGPSILSVVLASPQVKLTKLSLEGYTVRQAGSRLFHAALPDQHTLESVWLKGDGENTVPDDLQIMVEGLSRLSNLKELVLKDVSDEFTEENIVTLAVSLPLLEDLWTSGGEVSSNLLEALLNLQLLKSLTLYAMTSFKYYEIMDFLFRLNVEKQKGFTLSLMAVDADEGEISEEEQELIREFIRVNLDGRFEFVYWREAEDSQSEYSD